MKIIISALISALLIAFFLVNQVEGQETASVSGSLIKIYAAGTLSPSIELIIKDSKVATFTDIKGNPHDRQFQEFQYQSPNAVEASQVKVRFINDIGPSRDLRIDKITINGVDFESESEWTFLHSESSDCTGGFLQTEWVYCNSSVQYDYHIATTPSPTPTAAPICPHKSIGDADCNDIIDIVDFEIWRREYSSLRYTGLADFDKNGNITAVDYEIWRKTFYKQLQLQ